MSGHPSPSQVRLSTGAVMQPARCATFATTEGTVASVTGPHARTPCACRLRALRALAAGTVD